MLTEPNLLKDETIFLIVDNKLEEFRRLIKSHPEVLNYKDSKGFTPVFYSLLSADSEILKTIIHTDEKVLEQKNENGETPILLLIQLHIDMPSEKNIEKLKFIFQKQFNRDLEDKEIKNLSDFIKNFNFLKLFYDDLGQAFYDGQLGLIISSFLPKEEDLGDGLTKDLVKIYKEITKAKIPVFEFIDDDEKRKKLHVYQAEIGRHSAYFIFHVDDKNQLTKISYCDGNQFFKDQDIGDGTFINGITTFELKEPIYFANPTSDGENFFQDFIQKTSRGKDFEVFYKEFAEEKLAQNKIGEIEFSAKTHSIPVKKQTRLNCSLKSMFLLGRFILEATKKEKLFTLNSINSMLVGEGYKAHKELKQKIVDKGTEKLIESAEKINKDFISKTGVFERIFDFWKRSVNKKSSEKEDSKTEFLPIAERKFSNFRAQILTAKLCSDDEKFHQELSSEILKNFLNLILVNNINFDEIEIKKIGSLLSEKDVKIDEFLDLKFPTSQVKNNFIKIVLEHGNTRQKTDFLQKISHLDSSKIDEFFKNLNDENIALITRETEEQKIKLHEEYSALVSLGNISSKVASIRSSFACVRVEKYDEIEDGRKRAGKDCDRTGEASKDQFSCQRLTEKKPRNNQAEFRNDNEKMNVAGLSPEVIDADEIVSSELSSSQL